LIGINPHEIASRHPSSAKPEARPMVDTRHLLKVAAAWVSIVYLVCFGAVALFPQARQLFAKYALHIEVEIGNVITPLTFVTGLILWNVVAVLAVALFAVLFDRLK
jgi:hypothetical protein